jgi:outer membrane protein OmpA-like peptidoglycan-associated protein
VQEAAAAEARRVREAAEAQRIQDSINTAKAAAERLAAVPKKEVVVPKPEPPKPAALKAEVGKAIILEGVVFQSGKAVISPESEQILSSALITLTDNPGLAVEIRGFTDNVGSAKKNLQLSQSRAEAVKAWLVKNGVSSKRITAKGYGDRNPVASNKTAEGRVKNRRIEFLRTK